MDIDSAQSRETREEDDEENSGQKRNKIQSGRSDTTSSDQAGSLPSHGSELGAVRSHPETMSCPSLTSHPNPTIWFRRRLAAELHHMDYGGLLFCKVRISWAGLSFCSFFEELSPLKPRHNDRESRPTTVIFQPFNLCSRAPSHACLSPYYLAIATPLNLCSQAFHIYQRSAPHQPPCPKHTSANGEQLSYPALPPGTSTLTISLTLISTTAKTTPASTNYPAKSPL